MSFSYKLSCSLAPLTLLCAASPACLQPFPSAALQGTHTSYSCFLDHRYIHAHTHAYTFRAIHVPRCDPSLGSNHTGTGNSGLTCTVTYSFALHAFTHMHSCALTQAFTWAHAPSQPCRTPLSREVGTLGASPCRRPSARFRSGQR